MEVVRTLHPTPVLHSLFNSFFLKCLHCVCLCFVPWITQLWTGSNRYKGVSIVYTGNCPLEKFQVEMFLCTCQNERTEVSLKPRPLTRIHYVYKYSLLNWQGSDSFHIEHHE